MSKSKIEEGLPKTKDGLPWQAFAIVGDKEAPATWKLPHHTKAIFRAIKGKVGHYRTTDWEHLAAAVAALSRGGFRGKRVEATDQQILDAARHLSRHYTENDKPVPDTLAALVE
jgi:ABC-type tungstate transport system permease subunit